MYFTVSTADHRNTSVHVTLTVNAINRPVIILYDNQNVWLV